MSSARTIYATPPDDTVAGVDLTTDQDVAGEKTFTELLAAQGDAQLGPDANNLRVGALGDTSGVWVDAVLGSTNPNVSVNVRPKGPSGKINLLGPTDVTVTDGGGLALSTKVDGDTGRRIKVAASGGVSWGDGTDEDLTNVYRVGTEMHSDNTWDVAGLKIAGTSAGTAATKNVGTTAGTVAAGDDSRITGAAAKANNLSDLANAGTARTNLGLGGAATLAVGTTAGTVAAGDDSRITGAAAKANNLSDLANTATARTNLGLGTAAVLASGAVAQTANNLSDLANAGTARTNLGLGTAAVLAAGGASGAAQLDSSSKLVRAQLPVIGTMRNDILSGAYYAIPGFGSTQSSAMTADRAYALPFIPSVDATLGDFGIECSAVATAGNVRAGLYTSTAGRPDQKIVDMGQVAAPTGVGAMMWWTVSQALTAGVQYWAVVVAQGLTGSPTFRQRNTNSPELHFGTSRPATLGGSFAGVYSDTGFSGALPTSFGTAAGVTTLPCMCLKMT